MFLRDVPLRDILSREHPDGDDYRDERIDGQKQKRRVIERPVDEDLIRPVIMEWTEEFQFSQYRQHFTQHFTVQEQKRKNRQ